MCLPGRHPRDRKKSRKIELDYILLGVSPCFFPQSLSHIRSRYWIKWFHSYCESQDYPNEQRAWKVRPFPEHTCDKEQWLRASMVNLCLHSCIQRFRKVVGFRGEEPQLPRGGRIWIFCEECLKSVDMYMFATSPTPKHPPGTIWASRQEWNGSCHIKPGRLLLGALIPVSLFSRKRSQTSPIGVPPYG